MDLPNLEFVGGSLWFETAGQISALNFPKLSEVGGRLYLHNLGVGGNLSFPSLKRAHDLFIYQINMVKQIAFPKLLSVASNFRIFFNSALTTFTFPSLATIGGQLELNKHLVLTSLKFPALTEVGRGIIITDNKKLTSVAFPKLVTICTNRNCGISIVNNGLSIYAKLNGCDAVRKACRDSKLCGESAVRC